MMNCYLKTSKYAMYFFPRILSSHRFACLLATVREAIEANQLLQINLDINTSNQKTESTRLSGTIKNKYTAISTNCKSAIIKVFRDFTDQHLIQNSFPSQALHGRFINIRHFVNIFTQSAWTGITNPLSYTSFKLV